MFEHKLFEGRKSIPGEGFYFNYGPSSERRYKRTTNNAWTLRDLDELHEYDKHGI